MAETVNPNMIVLAREARGLTQNALAKKLDVTQGAMSRMERGQLRITDETLGKLSDILDYPPSFFYQTFQVYPPGMHFYRYRQHRSLPAKTQQRICAWMNIQRYHINKLLDAADIDYVPVPQCDVADYEDPAEVAQSLRQYLRLPRGPIKNLTEVLEQMGIVIVPCKFGTRLFSGVSIFTEKPNFLIMINADMSGDRYRWTLAHELGHILMHQMPTPEMEEEADAFAGELLMPRLEIIQHLSHLSLDMLASLKGFWKTSMAAILVHARRLGAITDRHYRFLWTVMSKAGYRLKEPPELDVPREEPKLLSELLDLHLKEFHYTVEQLSDSLSISVADFTDLYDRSEKRLKLIQTSA